jgi:hypothetical protein
MLDLGGYDINKFEHLEAPELVRVSSTFAAEFLRVCRIQEHLFEHESTGSLLTRSLKRAFV